MLIFQSSVAPGSKTIFQSVLMIPYTRILNSVSWLQLYLSTQFARGGGVITPPKTKSRLILKSGVTQYKDKTTFFHPFYDKITNVRKK